MRRREEFSFVVRHGKRVRKGCVVVHYLAPAANPGFSPGVPTRIGFVAGRQVGGSVNRHRVIRQLRHVVRGLLAELPDGALIVVRALPAAAGCDWSRLCQDVAASLRLVKGGRE